jgi:hypothetical protein
MGQAHTPDLSFDNEDLLPDDYPIYGDYIYVVDGKPYRSDWHGITARELRLRLKASEIRRCNLVARQAALSSARATGGTET